MAERQLLQKLESIEIERMFKILVLGAKGVGKTTLISLYTGIAIQDMQQVSIKEIELIGQPYVVNMLDGDELGEERITDDRTTYYPDIILILFHVLNQASLDTAYQHIQHYRDYYPLAHISILGTHTDLRNIPRIVSKEEIKDMCHSYYPQLWYFEVSRSDITSYESALLPSIAKIVFTNSLPKIHDQTAKEKLLYSVFNWCLMQKHDQLLEYLIEQRFFPPTRIIKEFPELTGKYIALKFPLTKYCVVTDKCVEIKKRINSNTVYEDDYDFTLDSDNHPIETKECVAEYNSNMQLDWSSLNFHYVYPTWFKLKSPECIVDRTVTIIKLSHNHLTSIPRELFNLKSLTYLDVSHNALTLLPGLWVLTSKLEVFLANDNNIGRISLEDMPYDYMFDVKNSNNSEHNEFYYQNNEYNSRNIALFNGPDLTSDILGLIENEYCLKVHNKIWMLQLQNNQLFELPLLFINYLPELEYLDISQNQINKILPGINFKQLKYLNVDNLPLIYPPKYIAEMGITNILRFMNQVSFNNPVMWHRHRIVVVGDQKSGKSSLIEKLIGKASYTPHIDGAALNINHWKVKSKTIQFWKKFQACFDIWEFSGKEIYQPIYSMFRPTSSLHIVVYNAEVYLTKLRPKESDDDPLKQFLRNLQVVVQDQKKRIKCVLVFTHMDLITKDQRELKRQLIIKSLRAYINDNNLVYLREFTKSESDIQTSSRSLSRGNKKNIIYPSSSRNSLLPDVIDVLFVSGKTGEGISNLQKRLSQDILVSLDDASFVKQVPQSYIEIDMRIKMALDNIKSRGNNRTGNEQPFEKLMAKPFVCSEDILDKMLSSPSFKLEEELNLDSLQGMLRFFHEEGIIFQYPTSRNKCYISFNPEDLAGAIAFVINSANSNTQSPSGLIKVNELFSNVSDKNSLPCSLSMSKKKFEDSFYMDFECEGKESEIIHEDFMLFLNENNISVNLNQNNILIPASLPPKKPECMKETKDATPITCELSEMRLKRLYNIMFLPSNFWNILICTLLNNILPVVWPGGYKLENIKVFDDICPRHQQSSNANPIKFDDNQLPRKYRRVTNTFYNACTVQNMSDCTMTDEEIIFNENDSKIIYWKKGLFIRSASGWKIKVSASNEEESKSTLIRCKGGIEVSIYADLISVEARLLRIVHNTILRVIATKFPGLWGLSNINTPWVEVFSIYKTSSSYTETAKNNQHNRERYDRLIDILKSSVYPLSYHKVNKLLPKLETIPDILIKDLPKKLAVNQNERSSLFTSQEDDSVFSHLSDGGDAANGNELNHFLGHFHRQLCNEKWVNQADRVNEGISQLNSLENPFKLIIREANILLHLTHPTIVSLSGINLHPPILLLEKAPYGSLRDVLLEKRQLDHREAHSVAIEVLTALEHLHFMNICHSHLTSDSILIFSIDPVCIKLSDKGLSHNPRQPLINTRVDQDLLLNQETALDILQFGFLLFEISTGHRPFEDVFSLQEVIRLAFHSRLTLNIEAYILFQIEEAKQNSTKLQSKRSSIISPCARTSTSSVCDYFELHKAEVSACHRLCMQPLLEICLDPKQRRNITTLTLHSRLILCAGNLSWSPLTSNINMQSIMTGMDSDLYWASGTRGLLVGNINTRTGKCIKRALTRPDKRRQNTEHIQAIGNVTCMTKVTATSQLWIGIENTTTGALYVYDMPGMKNYYHGQLQDAVLSILPIDKEWEKMKLLRPDLSEETCEGLKYRVLVGLANGNIIIFMGKNGQEVTENPLAGDKAVLLQTTKPCCSMLIAPNGLIWAACGDEILVLNPITLKEDPKYKGLCHTREQQSEVVYSKNFISKECVTSMVLSRVGIWTIARRCSVMWLWDWMTGELIAIFDLQKLPEIPPEAVEEVTTVAPQDDLLWVGTKSGLLILLDIDKIKSLLPKKTHKRLVNSSSMEISTNHRYSYLGQGNNKTFLDNSSLKEMRDIPQITGLSTETSPMIAYQECSIGKIRYIQPLSSKDIKNDPEIACSVDRDMDEVSSRLMIWKFLSRAKIPRCQLKESANVSSSEES